MRLKIPLSHIYHCPAPITPDQLIYATLLSLHRRLGDKTLSQQATHTCKLLAHSLLAAFRTSRRVRRQKRGSAEGTRPWEQLPSKANQRHPQLHLLGKSADRLSEPLIRYYFAISRSSAAAPPSFGLLWMLPCAAIALALQGVMHFETVLRGRFEAVGHLTSIDRQSYGHTGHYWPWKGQSSKNRVKPLLNEHGITLVCSSWSYSHEVMVPNFSHFFTIS